MIDAGVVPLTVFAENEHFFGYMISVDHIEVDNSVLLEEQGPRGAPVVVAGDRDKLLKWDPELVDATQAKYMYLHVAGIGKELHLQNVVFGVQTLKSNYDMRFLQPQ